MVQKKIECILSVCGALESELRKGNYIGEMFGSSCSMTGNPVRYMNFACSKNKLTDEILNKILSKINEDYEGKVTPDKFFDSETRLIIKVKLKDTVYFSKVCGKQDKPMSPKLEKEKSIPIGEACPRSIGRDCPYPLGTLCSECPKIEVEIDDDEPIEDEEECVKCKDEPEVCYENRFVELTVYKDCLLRIISNLSKDKSVRRIDVCSYCAGSYELEIQIAEEV